MCGCIVCEVIGMDEVIATFVQQFSIIVTEEHLSTVNIHQHMKHSETGEFSDFMVGHEYSHMLFYSQTKCLSLKKLLIIVLIPFVFVLPISLSIMFHAARGELDSEFEQYIGLTLAYLLSQLFHRSTWFFTACSLYPRLMAAI